MNYFVIILIAVFVVFIIIEQLNNRRKDQTPIIDERKDQPPSIDEQMDQAQSIIDNAVDQYRLIVQLAISRALNDGIIDQLTGKKVTISKDDIEDHTTILENMNPMQLMGMPEGSIVTIVSKYYVMKKFGFNDKEAINSIQKIRVQVGFPNSNIPESVLSATNPIINYVIHRIRIEESEWNEKNISDKTIRSHVKKVLKKYSDSDPL